MRMVALILRRTNKKIIERGSYSRDFKYHSVNHLAVAGPHTNIPSLWYLFRKEPWALLACLAWLESKCMFIFSLGGLKAMGGLGMV